LNEKTTSRSRFQPLIKIAGSLLALYLLYTQIDFEATIRIISRSNIFFLLAALIFFNGSQLVSAFRLNVFFKKIHISLSDAFNIRLYYIGMFYNLLLPGGIGGDAYKGYLLNKHFGTSASSLAGAMIADRASGLFAILILSAFFGIRLAPQLPLGTAFLVAGGTGGLIAGFFLFRLIFKRYRDVFFVTILLSILVQGLQLMAIWFILMSIGINHHIMAYLLIFLVSSVATIIPVTVGGLGLREIVFLYGARYFGLEAEISVSVSLLFFILTVLSSLSGLFFQYMLRDDAWRRQKENASA